MKTKIAQVTIANAANQAEKNNQRVQLSHPAYDWVMIKKYKLATAWDFQFVLRVEFGYMWMPFEYELKRSPYEVVKCSERTKHTDFPESLSLN